MKLSIHCPSCLTPMGAFSDDSNAQVHCGSCQRQYRVISGKVSKRASMREALLYLNNRLPQWYKRHYELRLTTGDRQLKVLKFSIPQAEDRVPVRRGDLVSILYTAHGTVFKKLIAITNHTTGNAYTLPTPATSLGYLATTRGTVAAALSVYFVLNGANLFLLSLLSVVGVFVYVKLAYTAELTTPPLQMTVHEEARLLADQKLLQHKHQIEKRVEMLRHECQANQTLMQQFEKLRQKMFNFDEKLYATRIQRTKSAVGILTKQNENNKRLIGEYSRMAKMIEIEIETAQIADQLPEVEDFTNTIVRKMAELKRVEEYNQNLRFQLEANEEVRRLRA